MLEVSTPPELTDVIGLEDDYGRTGTQKKALLTPSGQATHVIRCDNAGGGNGDRYPEK